MAALPKFEVMYQAILEKDSSLAGAFYVGVKTTGVFCRPGCPARCPKQENVEFFASSKEALFAGFRPCKRCRPLEHPDAMPEFVKSAVSLIEQIERVTDAELERNGISSERVRRWFKQHHDMSFQAYQRGLRLGKAMQAIKQGGTVIESGLFNGWESTSGFREAFHRAFGTSPTSCDGQLFKIKRIETPLGAMVAVGDDTSLYLLEFADRRMLATQMQTLKKRYGCTMAPGDSSVLSATRAQLDEYFAGNRREFSLPLDLRGSTFQQKVWQELLKVPYGRTLSYGEMASRLGCPDAQRAVGKANGDNRIAILVPCHRVIKSDGTLCGYGGGLWRKKRLLELEQGEASLF